MYTLKDVKSLHYFLIYQLQEDLSEIKPALMGNFPSSKNVE
jgi:hypothetical protein